MNGLPTAPGAPVSCLHRKLPRPAALVFASSLSKFVSCENPHDSFMCRLLSGKTLGNLCLRRSIFDHCQYGGSRPKKTLLLHNIPSFDKLARAHRAGPPPPPRSLAAVAQFASCRPSFCWRPAGASGCRPWCLSLKPSCLLTAATTSSLEASASRLQFLCRLMQSVTRISASCLLVLGFYNACTLGRMRAVQTPRSLCRYKHLL